MTQIFISGIMDGVTLHHGPIRLSHGIQGDDVILVTCGNNTLLISDATTLHVRDRVTLPTGDFVSCLHSPSVPLIVTGDTGNHVKSFWRKEKHKDGVLARLSLPPLCLAFSPSGTTLAAAGDADGIKLIDVKTSKVFRHLRPCSCVRGMAYDPKGVYLLIITSQGTLLIWNLEDGEACEKKTGASRKVTGTSVVRCDWDTHGRFFCIPDAVNGIGCYWRDTWQPVETLHFPLVHTESIVALSLSPNGAYLASGGEDARICIFYLPSSQCIAERKMDEAVSDLEWHPTQAQLTVATGSGTVYVIPWTALCVDPSLPDPLMDVNLDDLFSDSSEASVSDGVTSVSQSISEVHTHGWKRPRMDIDDRVHQMSHPMSNDHGVIHPGSTQASQENTPFFFCWNSEGHIVGQRSERSTSIQIHRSASKLPPFLDFDGCIMGSLGKNGAVFASPGRELASKGWRNAKLHHRSFNAWSHQAAWEVELLKEEQPICVAEGDTFCAVCTSRHLLRLFTSAGLAIHVFTTPHHVIGLVAKGPVLTMFFQTSSGAIEFQMYDVPRGLLKQQGHVHCCRLIWVGFSDEGLLHVMDDAMCVYCLMNGFGGQWVPVFNGTEHLSSMEAVFVVSINQKHITLVRHQCHTQPQVQPPSILEDLPVSYPVLENSREEQTFLIARWMIDVTDRPSTAETEKMLLTMFHTAVKNGREEAGLEIVQMMQQPLYIQGALRLANHNRLMILSEAISRILENKELDPQS